MATKLSASAKPFSFNPSAKSFVFQPAAPPPPPPQPKRQTYTTDELFELQQPLYSGSTLVFSTDLDLSSILLYDPCFDYLAAGLIAAVPIQPVDGKSEEGWQQQQQTKRAAAKKSKKTTRVAAPSTIDTLATTTPADTADTTTGTTSVVAVVVEGVRQASLEHNNEDEEEEDSAGSDEEEEEEEDGEDDESEEEDEDDEDAEDEEVEGDGHYLRQPQQQQQYVWVAQPYAMTGGAEFDQQQSASDFYYPSAASTGSYYPQEDMPDGRRRQYMSHFSQQQQQGSHYSSHAPHSSSSYYNSSSSTAASASSHSSHRYPSSKHHNGGGHHNHNGHSNNNHSSNYGPYNDSRTYIAASTSNGQGVRPRHVYDRFMLLDLRMHESCQERPQNLPHFLADIYKTNSSSASAASASSRSLFGNASASSGSASRSVFGSSSGALQANMNHSQACPDSDAEESENQGMPPKRGQGKIKSKRKKNKDRSARAIDDDLISVQDAAAKTKAARGNNRARLDSVDHDDQEERKDDGHGGKSTTLRGLSTPKHKPIKQKQGKKGGGGGGKKGAEASLHKKAGGGGPNSSFHLDSHEFDHATMADLHHCANKWQPSIAQPLSLSASGSGGDIADSLRQAEKVVRSILNKLSIDKLDALLSTMLSSIQIDCAEVLQVIVDILFDKSVDEPEFAGLYARFCAMLSPYLPEFTQHIGAASTGGGGGGGTSSKATSKTFSFRTMLLTRCYTMLVEDEESLKQSLMATAIAQARSKEFSLDGGSCDSGSMLPSSLSPRRTLTTVGLAASSRTNSPLLTAAGVRTGSPNRTLSPRILSATTSPRIGASATPLEIPLVTSLELAEKLHLLQVHQRGNLIFIGELFKQNMLSHSVVHLCLDMLLDDQATGPDAEPSEWDVECVCIFLACVGKKLDEAANGLDIEGDASDPSSIGTDGASLQATRRALIDGHFHKISLLSRCVNLPSRFRFMLQDLMDLRTRSWVPRIQKTIDPTISLNEIRENAAAVIAATPQHHGNKSSYAHAMTSVKKGGFGGAGTNSKSYFAAHNPSAASHAYHPHPHQQQQHLRTSVRPTGGAMRHVTGAAPSFSSQGRTLQFGASPIMNRSISAPDSRHNNHDNDDVDHRSNLPFSPMPALPTTTSTAAGAGGLPTPGTYVPAWKRRALGLDDQQQGVLLPRSAHGEQHDQLANPSFEAAADAEGDASMQSAATSSSAPTLSDAAMTHQLHIIFDELYSSHDVAEALQCLGELEQQVGSVESMHRQLVSILVSKCVEQPLLEARDLCAALLIAIGSQQQQQQQQQQEDGAVHASSLSSAMLIQGLIDFISTVLPDVSIDIPHAPTYTNRVLASLLKEGRIHVQQVWTLFAEALKQDGALELSQAQSWTIDTLSQLRQMCTDEESMMQLLTQSTSSASSSSMNFADALFDGEAQAVERALEAHNLAFLAPTLLSK